MPVLHPHDIPPLDRFGMYAMLGLVRVMEPHTEDLMRERAQALIEEDEYDSPHERPWFVSFHGSEFPGVAEDTCQRYLAYRMMNFPATEAMPPWVTTTGTVGKAGELDIADAWHKGGRLLAIPEDPEIKEARLRDYIAALESGNDQAARYYSERRDIHQLGFADPEIWMTVSTDLPILPPGWTRPYIVEIKGKADEVVEEMLNGRLLQRPNGHLERVGRGPESRHAIQLKATIGEAHEYDWGEATVCSGCWKIIYADIFERLAGSRLSPAISAEQAAEDNLRHCPWCGHEGWTTFHLDPPTSGEIYYWSRSWPRKTKSFYYELDKDFMAAGKRVLAEVKEHYIADQIPPRPEHFQWNVGPCGTCSFRKFCRLDCGLPPRARKVRPDMVRTTLSESNGVEHAQSVRPLYDPHAVRERVFQEWGHAD